MFGKTTQSTLPPEFLKSYAKWDGYMAHVWAALLRGFSYHPRMTIIEVAPGTSTKIGGALHELLFQGTLYIVEPLASALLTTHEQYKKLLPKAQIIPIHQTLRDSMKHLPLQADFLLSNHPLDDMIMSFPFKTDHQKAVFDWSAHPSHQVSAAFIAHWSALSSHKAILNSIEQQIIEDWKFVLDTLKPSTTLISQYASDALEKHHLHTLNEHAFKILKTLKTLTQSNQSQALQDILNQFENYNRKYIGMEVLNAKNWLCTTSILQD